MGRPVEGLSRCGCLVPCRRCIRRAGGDDAGACFPAPRLRAGRLAVAGSAQVAVRAVRYGCAAGARPAGPARRLHRDGGIHRRDRDRDRYDAEAFFTTTSYSLTGGYAWPPDDSKLLVSSAETGILTAYAHAPAHRPRGPLTTSTNHQPLAPSSLPNTA